MKPYGARPAYDYCDCLKCCRGDDCSPSLEERRSFKKRARQKGRKDIEKQLEER